MPDNPDANRMDVTPALVPLAAGDADGLTRRQLLERAGALGVSLAGANLLLTQTAAAADTPALIVAQGLTDTTAELAWMAVPGATEYRIYRDGSLITDVPGTRHSDGSLTPQNAYVYAVSAVVGGVESPLSHETAAITQAPADTTAPTLPGPIIVEELTATTAKLNWEKSTDDVKVVGYRVYRGPVGAPPEQLAHIATTDNTSSYNAVDLRSATDYQFGVAAIDAANNLSPLQTVMFTTAASTDVDPPLPPSDGSVAATAFSSSRIDVVWGNSDSTDVAAYQVFRNGVLIGEVELPFRKRFSDSGLQPSTTYTYVIRAVDSAGNVSAPTAGRNRATLAAGTVRIARGPYIQWVTRRSARIAWWTNLPTQSVVEYGIGGLTDSVQDQVPRNQHMMLIGGLDPGTEYQYRVGDGTTFSATFTFATAAKRGQTFSFAAVGDYGGGGSQTGDVADQIAAGPTEFVQTLGDNVYPDAQDPDFLTVYSDFDHRLYKPYTGVIREQTFWTANGNKEYFGDGAHWRNFWLPNNRRWYSYNWGDAHMLVLDSEQPFSPGSPQYNFARLDLSHHQRAVWRIVVIHVPPFSSSAPNSGSLLVRQHLVPLFQRYRVNLVMSGNSHNYERSHPLIDGEVAPRGIVYIVSGGGGNGHNTFDPGDPPAWSAARNDTDYEHLRVTVSSESLLTEAISESAGAVFDSTTIPAL